MNKSLLHAYIQEYKNQFQTIHYDEIYKWQAVKHFQDHWDILVYLNLRYPERYYLFKFTMFRDFAVKLALDYIPVKGRMENIGQYLTLCDLVNYEIKNDQELLKLHKGRISDDCYYDKNAHILTQDFIYAVARDLSTTTSTTSERNIAPSNPILSNPNDIHVQNQHVDLTPRLVNHLENMTENKKLGDLGEQWVLRFEKDRLKKAGKTKLAADIKHISSEKGDGAGFDISSFEEDGSQRLIEVKTTKGGYSQPFYITRNELEKSRTEKVNYYLYRLYNYNEEADTAELLLIKGELSSLCNFPTLYKVCIKD